MKGLRIALIAILCGLIIVLCGGMFLAMSGKLGVWQGNSSINLFGFSMWDSAVLRNTEEIEVEDITSLKFNGEKSMVDIFIKPTDQDKIIMEEYFTKNLFDRELAEVVKTQNRLEIIPDKSKRTFSFGNNYAYIVLQVPERLFGQLQELLVNTSSGDIKIEGFQELQEKGLLPETVLLASTSGDMTADYLKAGTIQLASASGDITMDYLKAGTIQLAATSGDMQINYLDAEEIQAATTSGDITIRKVIGDIRISSTSGDQYINEVEGKLNMAAQSGDLTAGAVTGELAMEATSGDVYAKQLNGKGYFTTSSGEISVKADGLKDSLTISATSGDINLTVPSDSEFNLEIETTSGDIWTKYDNFLSYNKKENHAKGAVGENPDIEIMIQSTSGDVALH